MKFKTFLFPIFVLAVVACFLFSCNKTASSNTDEASNKLIDKALEFHQNQKSDSAFYYFDRAKNTANSKENAVYSLIMMANIQLIQSDFAGSETTITEALKSNTKPTNLTSIYNILGMSYLEQFDFVNSLTSYKKALQFAESEPEKLIIKNNIGYLYLKSGNYKKAIATLQPLLLNDTLHKYSDSKARVLDNLGFAYFKLNNPEAQKILEEGLKLREIELNDIDKIASYIHLSEFYQFANTPKARNYAAKAYQIATNQKSTNDRLEALLYLTKTSEPTAAKKFGLQQMQLSDSINKVRKMARNEFAKIKYDSKKSELEKEKYQRMSENLLALLGGLLIVFLLIYLLIRSKSKRNLEQNTYSTEIRISKKLHDELANDVYNTLTFVETQDLKSLDKVEILLNKLDEIYNRTRNISKENSAIEIGEKFADDVREMISTYNSNDVKVILSGFNEINWQKLNNSKQIIIYRVIQELLVNMKKHSQCTITLIGFKNNKSNLEISYSDNGIGTTSHNFIKNGLQNVENRIETIKGTITFDGTKGFKCKISLPI